MSRYFNLNNSSEKNKQYENGLNRIDLPDFIPLSESEVEHLPDSPHSEHSRTPNRRNRGEDSSSKSTDCRERSSLQISPQGRHISGGRNSEHRRISPPRCHPNFHEHTNGHRMNRSRSPIRRPVIPNQGTSVFDRISSPQRRLRRSNESNGNRATEGQYDFHRIDEMGQSYAYNHEISYRIQRQEYGRSLPEETEINSLRRRVELAERHCESLLLTVRDYEREILNQAAVVAQLSQDLRIFHERM